jgi:UDP-N-acetylmuramoyl-L-alanyl-D-glutamate--2,6-diaminopimelate ligase
VDRKEAIKKALSLAKSGDIVVLTGKGGESLMCVGDNKKIPWNEREIVEELLK